MLHNEILCDVHISCKLVTHLNSFGFEAVHVNQILNKYETTDADISKYTDQHNCVVLLKMQILKIPFYCIRPLKVN